MKFRNFLLTVVAMIAAVAAFGQTDSITTTFPTPDSSTAGEFLAGWVELLYGALVVIGGYLSSFIPGLNKIDKTVYRVAAFALAVGALFVSFTPMSAFSTVVTYAMSTSIYELILKLFKKTPQVEG
jgi:hypothetical protein